MAGQRYWSTLLPPDVNSITSGIWTPDDQHVYLGTSQVITTKTFSTFFWQKSYYRPVWWWTFLFFLLRIANLRYDLVLERSFETLFFVNTAKINWKAHSSLLMCEIAISSSSSFIVSSTNKICTKYVVVGTARYSPELETKVIIATQERLTAFHGIKQKK